MTELSSWQEIDCPSCTAKKGQRCRSAAGTRTTTHVLRIDRWHEVRRRRRESPDYEG